MPVCQSTGLEQLESLVFGSGDKISQTVWANGIARLKSDLSVAFYNDIGDQVLRRYFSDHLRRLAIMDTRMAGCAIPRPESNDRQELLSVITWIKSAYPDFFDYALPAAPGFHENWLAVFRVRYQKFKLKSAKREIDPALKNLLLGYLDGLVNDGAKTPAYITLDYADTLLQRLEEVFSNAQLVDYSAEIIAVLVCTNFNHLGFFAHYIEVFNSGVSIRSTSLQQLRIELYPLTLQQQAGYDPTLPSIASLLYHWAGEQLAGLPDASAEVRKRPHKLAIALSVSQFACLLRSFYEAGLFPGISLTALFSFATSHFTTKRQSDISQGSLSKEYYSITLHTAARIMALFNGLGASLKRHYFPVLVVLSSIVLAH